MEMDVGNEDIIAMADYEELKNKLEDNLIEITNCVALKKEQIDEAMNRGYE